MRLAIRRRIDRALNELIETLQKHSFPPENRRVSDFVLL